MRISSCWQAEDIFLLAGSRYLLTDREQLSSYRQAALIFLKAGNRYLLVSPAQQIPPCRQAADFFLRNAADTFLQAGSSYLLTGRQLFSSYRQVAVGSLQAGWSSQRYSHRKTYDSPYFRLTIFRGSLILLQCTFDNRLGYFKLKKDKTNSVVSIKKRPKINVTRR